MTSQNSIMNAAGHRPHKRGVVILQSTSLYIYICTYSAEIDCIIISDDSFGDPSNLFIYFFLWADFPPVHKLAIRPSRLLCLTRKVVVPLNENISQHEQQQQEGVAVDERLLSSINDCWATQSGMSGCRRDWSGRFIYGLHSAPRDLQRRVGGGAKQRRMNQRSLSRLLLLLRLSTPGRRFPGKSLHTT